MEQITQDAIKAIAALGISNNQSLGDLLTPIYFKKDRYALFLNYEKQTVELLIPPNKNHQNSIIRFFLSINRTTFNFKGIRGKSFDLYFTTRINRFYAVL